MSDGSQISDDGKIITIDGIDTYYQDVGEGEPVLFIHGSEPGVSAWANWRLNLGPISQKSRCIAPDMVGFGKTVAPENYEYSMTNWVKHLYGLTQELGLGQTTIVGNSFGGGLAIAFAIAHPELVSRIVLMGAVGVEFELTYGLNEVWGYEPSVENMKELLDIFSHDKTLVNDDLASLRYSASVAPGIHESYSAMFPAPRQKWIHAMASETSDISKIKVPVLIVHGKNDRVIPIGNSHKFFELLPNAELHLFSNCGHWTQIEKRDRFNALVLDFIAGGSNTS